MPDAVFFLGCIDQSFLRLHTFTLFRCLVCCDVFLGQCKKNSLCTQLFSSPTSYVSNIKIPRLLLFNRPKVYLCWLNLPDFIFPVSTAYQRILWLGHFTYFSSAGVSRLTQGPTRLICLTDWKDKYPSLMMIALMENQISSEHFWIHKLQQLAVIAASLSAPPCLSKNAYMPISSCQWHLSICFITVTTFTLAPRRLGILSRTACSSVVASAINPCLIPSAEPHFSL